MILNELEIFRDSLLSYRDNFKPVNRPLFNTFFNKETQKWLFPKQAAEELSTRCFFKRFTKEELEGFLSKMIVKQHNKGTVVFPDD